MRKCKLCAKVLKPGNGTFFCVPKDEEKRRKWGEICKMNFTPTAQICIDHFYASDIIFSGKKRMLLPNAVPIVDEAPKPTFLSPQVRDFNCVLCRKKCHPDNGKYFRIPEDESRRKLWSESCRMQFLPDGVICEDHFSPNSFIKYKNQVTLLPNAVPLPPRLSIKQIQANIASEEVVIDDDNRSEISVNVPISSSCLLLEDPLSLNKIPLVEQEFRKHFVDKEIQTDPNMIGYEKYIHKCRQLETEIKELKLQIMQSNMAMHNIYKIFTEGQIRKLMSPSYINWRDHDMKNALELYKAGSRAYKYLYKKGFPLPHISSLQRWKQRPKKNEIKNIKSAVPLNEIKEKDGEEEKREEEDEDEEEEKEREEEEEEVNDFSGDDNDWFDEFYEEETVNNVSEENIVTNPDCKIINKSSQNENLKGENRNQENHSKVILSVPSQYASPELNAIIASSNDKVFIVKKPLELDKSKEQNSRINAQSQSISLVVKGATSARSQRDIPDLNCITPVKNISGTIDRVANEQGINENQSVKTTMENYVEPLDYNQFLNSIDSGDYLDILDETVRI